MIMQLSVMFKELGYTAVKVMAYRMLHPRHASVEGLSRWLEIDLDEAKVMWEEGREELTKKGYLKEDQWTNKAKRVLGR